MKKYLVLIVSFAIFITLWNCQTSEPVHPLKIAISKGVPEKDYENYLKWLKYADSTILFYDMYHLELDSALKLFETCDGLLLTGGTDVYPGRFGKENDTARILTPDFKRDTLEFALLSKAIEKRMPVQGVCRGLQLINVHFGGSLIIDIPEDLNTIIKHQFSDTYNCPHEVTITSGSLLNEISGTQTGITNSNHHQGIEVLGSELQGMATTNDGLIEAIGVKDDGNYGYLFAVQWHPERMDYTNPLSGSIAKRFIKEVNSYASKNNHEKK
jgi:putative glutamine amidotransferase